MNSKVTYIQPGCKKIIFNLVVVYEKKKIVEGKRERRVRFII